MIGNAEQCQKYCAQSLKKKTAHECSRHEGGYADNQVFLHKKAGYLLRFQTDQHVGSEFTASSGQHEPGGVVDQPADDTYHYDAGEHDHGGQVCHTHGQFQQFF